MVTDSLFLISKGVATADVQLYCASAFFGSRKKTDSRINIINKRFIILFYGNSHKFRIFGKNINAFVKKPAFIRA